MTTTIKPLEWEDIGSGFSRARAPLFGNIRVEKYGARFTTYYSVPGYANTFAEGDFSTAEDAKAACEAEYQRRMISALAPQAGDNAEEPVAVLDDLHSVMCLLETLSEAMPADDVSAVMMSVMANNIRQKHFGGTDAIASHPCTSTTVVSQNAPDLEDKGGDGGHPSPNPQMMGSYPIREAIAILQTAVQGNCDHKNRHGYGDCGAEKIIADALAVLQGKVRVG